MFLGNRSNLTSTEEFHPIRRIGIPRIDAAASELFNVWVTLKVTPPLDWREAFLQFEKGVERSTYMFQNPSLVGKALSVRGVPEKDVEVWLKLIDTKIAGANVQHTEQTPATRAALREREAAGAQRQHDAQTRADQIARRWEAPDA